MITVEVVIPTIQIEAVVLGATVVSCLDATVENSDGSFIEQIASGDTLILDDYDIETYLNGVLIQTDTAPAMEDITITISN